MNRQLHGKGLALVSVLILVSLLLGACTTVPIPIPVGAPMAPAVQPAAEDEAAVKEVVSPVAPLTLEGVTWQVGAYRNADGALSAPPAPATMLFEGGQISGSGGCNRFFGGYTAAEGQLAIADIASTMMMCEEDVAAAEQALFAIFSQVDAFAVVGQQMHLFDADGAILLSAAPEVVAEGEAMDVSPDPVTVEEGAPVAEVAAAAAQAPNGRVLAQLGVNVRTGPGAGYPIVGIAPEGTEGEIVGVSEDGEWWVANVPAAPNGQGWVAAAYIEAIGADNVPVIPAPTLPEQTAAIQEGTPYQPTPGIILFSASRVVQEGNRVYELEDVYAVSSTPGSQPQMIANNAMQPALSPDRSTLAFHSTQSDKLGLGGVDLASGRRLRFSAFHEDSSPRWNPAGDQIVFASNLQGDRRWRIYTTPAVDKERPADMAYNQLAFGKDPDWHPSQDLIVFKGCDDQGQNCGMYTMNSDGSNRTIFTNEASDSTPRWLPDGSAVVFMSEGRDGNWEIYSANAADGAVTRLTNDSAPDGLPAVSPDGSQIAFISKRSGAWALWVMPANGGAATQITAIAGELPDWLLQAVDWPR
jgi:Tol biopolymer transport system component/heat shock protein HslJ